MAAPSVVVSASDNCTGECRVAINAWKSANCIWDSYGRASERINKLLLHGGIS